MRYDNYIDGVTRVVKAPPGFATNDDCWRTSWFYASVLIIQAHESDLYESLQKDHGIDVSMLQTFLRYFRDNCLDDNGWKRPTSLSTDFSLDQLTPLLYLLACVKTFGPSESQPLAQEILTHLVKLDKERGAVSASKGKINDSLRYVIDVLSHKYGIDYIGGTLRGMYKIEFGLALKAHALLVQMPVEELATMDDFSVFNTLALVTLQCIFWTKDDSNVKDWRANYRQHADKRWGPAFRIVAGREVSTNEIDAYRTAHIKSDQDNDIILAQRPHKYISDKFPALQLSQTGGEGQWLVLDYLILKGLELAWR
jgi:hypothetical protein